MTMIEQFPPAERTVPRMLAQQQARFGARQALVIGDQSWSHAQVQQMAACRASVLQTVAQRGDRVALMCGNRPEFLECFLDTDLCHRIDGRCRLVQNQYRRF